MSLEKLLRRDKRKNLLCLVIFSDCPINPAVKLHQQEHPEKQPSPLQRVDDM